MGLRLFCYKRLSEMMCAHTSGFIDLYISRWDMLYLIEPAGRGHRALPWPYHLPTARTEMPPQLQHASFHHPKDTSVNS